MHTACRLLMQAADLACTFFLVCMCMETTGRRSSMLPTNVAYLQGLVRLHRQPRPWLCRIDLGAFYARGNRLRQRRAV